MYGIGGTSMKVKIKRHELFNIVNTLDTISSLKGNANFINAIAKNKKLIEKEVNDIKKTANLSESSRKHLDNYEQAMFDLENLAFTDQDAYRRKSNELREKNKNLFEEHKMKKGEVDNLLKEEVTIDFQPVKTKDYPKLSTKQKEIVQLFTDDR